MLTLYGAAGSGSAAVEAALEICAVPFRIVDAASWHTGPGVEELARVNPLRQIPTLRRDDGSVLSESAAILIHLGLAHPASGLLPAAPGPRDQAIRGLVYIAANCYAAIGVIDYPERWCVDGDDAVKASIRAGARRRLHGCWEIFADLFGAATPFIGGAAPGALDLLAAVVSKWSGSRQHLAGARPAFAALLQRIDAQPRVAAVFARHWPK